MKSPVTRLRRLTPGQEQRLGLLKQVARLLDSALAVGEDGAVPTTFSEEEFLGQIELAASRNGPAALRPLDAMTPRAWDVR